MKAIEDRVPFGLGRFISLLLIVFGVGWFIVAGGTAIYEGAIKPLAAMSWTGTLIAEPIVDEKKHAVALGISSTIVFLATVIAARNMLKLRRQFVDLRGRFRDDSLVTEGLRKMAIFSLTMLLESGRALLRRRISRHEGLKALKHDLSIWEASVEDILSKANCSMTIPQFYIVSADTSPLDGWNHEHRMLRRIIDERTRRLEEIIKRLEELEQAETKA